MNKDLPKTSWNAGEKNIKAKLTWDKVRRIRKFARYRVPVRRLAEDFGVSLSAVRNVISGLSWKEPTDDL